MIIHQCQSCDSISINRIAADDDYQELLMIMKQETKLSDERNHRLDSLGIEPVRLKDYHLVKLNLIGFA